MRYRLVQYSLDGKKELKEYSKMPEAIYEGKKIAKTNPTIAIAVRDDQLQSDVMILGNIKTYRHLKKTR
jgi:hypothetical protein